MLFAKNLEFRFSFLLDAFDTPLNNRRRRCNLDEIGDLP